MKSYPIPHPPQKCLECGKPVVWNNLTRNKKYCSCKCKDLVCSRKSYHLFRKFDPKRREELRQAGLRFRARKKQQGLCSRCGKEPSYGFSTCQKCGSGKVTQ